MRQSPPSRHSNLSDANPAGSTLFLRSLRPTFRTIAAFKFHIRSLVDTVNSMTTLFIDAAGISATYGTPIDTVRYWERLGKLPQSAKIGRRRVWRRDEIAAWFAAKFAA